VPNAANSIADRFDSRHNSVNALRLALAGLVLVSHAFKFQVGFDPLQPITLGAPDIGTIAVDCFFALSGFLITQSLIKSRSTGRYLWRRCLRILPGFWACLIVTAAFLLPVAQLIERGTLNGFPLTGELSATSYTVDNLSLYVRQFEVRGLLGGEAVNGSLYTLFYEMLCYIGLMVLAVFGLVRRRRIALLVLAGLLWLVVAVEWANGASVTGDHLTVQIAFRFGLMFLAGTVLRVWSERIPLTWGGAGAALLALGAAVLMAGLYSSEWRSILIYLLVAPAAIAYLVIFLGARPELARVGAKRDLSYGLYLYAWPVQVILLLVGAASWPTLAYIGAASSVALVLALLSWTLIESPALSLKSWTPSWPRRLWVGSTVKRASRPRG
jgi:peptidoglycan/LPS O-acetylase OafA/YrhL